jgi:hypothetical protein
VKPVGSGTTLSDLILGIFRRHCEEPLRRSNPSRGVRGYGLHQFELPARRLGRLPKSRIPVERSSDPTAIRQRHHQFIGGERHRDRPDIAGVNFQDNLASGRQKINRLKTEF